MQQKNNVLALRTQKHAIQKSVSVALTAFSLIFSTALYAQAPVTAAPIVVTDQRGIEVKLPHPVQRVVTIPMPMASVVMALDGSSRRVVGMHPASRQSIEEGFLRKIYPEALSIAADITRGGMFTPNLETVLALKPDVVVTWSEPNEAVQSMERAGLSVVTLQNSPPNLDRHFNNLEILGKVLGLQKRVAIVRDDIERKNSTVQRAMAGVSTKPRALYLVGAKAGFQVSGLNTFQDFWIKQAGGQNVAGMLPGQPNATLEQIILWDPEMIFLGTFDAAIPSDILSNSTLNNVSAVRNKRVYKVPHGGYRWDPGSHESGLMLLWAASVMHPELLKVDLRREMRNTYETLYRYKLGDGEIDEILQIRSNSSAPGYAARFAP